MQELRQFFSGGFANTNMNVSVGALHTAAISNGTLYTWGSGNNGRLGSGSMKHSVDPVAIDLGYPVVMVSAGGSHTAAVTSNGTLYTWGYGAVGQLGTGTKEDSLVPVAVDLLHGGYPQPVRMVSAGSNHTAVVTRSGVLYTWGAGFQGRLGTGTTKIQFRPVPIDLGIPVRMVAAGDAHTAAVTVDGTLYTWGAGGSGQLGTGTKENSLVPIAINLGDEQGVPVRMVSAGGAHTAAVTSNGELYTWGHGTYGQLGTGTGETSLVPLAIDLGVPVLMVSTGDYHTAAVTVGGTLYTWGYGGYGQLGTGTTESSLVPLAINFGDEQGDEQGVRVVTVSASGYRTAAVTLDGALYTWGNSQLGIDKRQSSVVPVPVNLPID